MCIFHHPHSYLNPHFNRATSLNARAFRRHSADKRSKENSDGAKLWDLHSITTDTTNRSTDFRGNTGGLRDCPAVAVCPMAEDLLQFYTKVTALVLLPLLKSRIILLVSSHVLQKESYLHST